MSQLPYSNVPPPPPGTVAFQTDPRLLAPARRAAILLFILGGLGILMGLCFAALPWLAPIDQILANSKMTLPEPPPGFTIGQVLRVMYTILGAMTLAISVTVIVMGVFVRQGRRWACITALVFCVLAILFFLVSVLVSLPQLLQNVAMLFESLCISGVPTALLVLAVVWLIQAIRLAPQVQLARQQYQMQMWQFQQQQPAPPAPTGWQSGYGMTPPPPPPAG